MHTWHCMVTEGGFHACTPGTVDHIKGVHAAADSAWWLPGADAQIEHVAGRDVQASAVEGDARGVELRGYGLLQLALRHQPQLHQNLAGQARTAN